MGAVLADAGSSYGIELSRKVAFLLAQEICLQLWPGIGLAKRKSACAEQISHLLGAVTSELPFASSVSDQVAADVEGALGISLDHFTKTLLTLCVASESRDAKALRTLCVILSHGYSTATSIADAANRMLGMHVYEAVDMPYDQQLKDIVGPLQRLVDRHSYCTGVVFLVDMGSLEEAYKALENVTDSTIGVVNNVSTGLALEIGVGLLGGKSIAEVLGDATAACVTHCKVIERVNREDAIVFCSESGVDAAERIRQLVSQSLPRTIGARLLTRPFKQLVANGSNDAVFSEHRVCAVIGTGDPGVASVPFVALEDIMSTAFASKVDAVFGRSSAPSPSSTRSGYSMRSRAPCTSFSAGQARRSAATPSLGSTFTSAVSSNALLPETPLRPTLARTASRRNAPISSSPSGRASRASRRAIA